MLDFGRNAPRVLSCTQITILKHNIGYEKSNLLMALFGTSANIEKSLKRWDMLREKMQTPKVQRKKKSKTEMSEEQQPGAFQ